MRTSWARISPSGLTPVRYRMTNGWRWGRASNDSCRDHAIRTGRRVRHTSRARYGSTVMSSLPPNPPPMYVAMTRTFVWGTPRIWAISRECSMTCVATLHVPFDQPVATGMELWRAGLQGLLRLEDTWEFLVVDQHELGRLLRG